MRGAANSHCTAFWSAIRIFGIPGRICDWDPLIARKLTEESSSRVTAFGFTATIAKSRSSEGCERAAPIKVRCL